MDRIMKMKEIVVCILQSSQNRLLIKGGKIVNADGMVDGEVFIEDGTIK